LPRSQGEKTEGPVTESPGLPLWGRGQPLKPRPPWAASIVNRMPRSAFSRPGATSPTRSVSSSMRSLYSPLLSLRVTTLGTVPAPRLPAALLVADLGQQPVEHRVARRVGLHQDGVAVFVGDVPAQCQLGEHAGPGQERRARAVVEVFLLDVVGEQVGAVVNGG